MKDRFCPLPTLKKWSWDAGYVSQWISTKVCRWSSLKRPWLCHILSGPLPSGLPPPLPLLLSGVVPSNKTAVLKTQLPVLLPVEARWSGPTERVLPNDSMLHSCDQGPHVLTRVVPSCHQLWEETAWMNHENPLAELNRLCWQELGKPCGAHLEVCGLRWKVAFTDLEGHTHETQCCLKNNWSRF